MDSGCLAGVTDGSLFRFFQELKLSLSLFVPPHCFKHLHQVKPYRFVIRQSLQRLTQNGKRSGSSGSRRSSALFSDSGSGASGMAATS